jgi:flagellar protein FliO/FliZ
MMRRFVFACALAACLASGAAQARRQAAPAASVPAAGAPAPAPAASVPAASVPVTSLPPAAPAASAPGTGATAPGAIGMPQGITGGPAAGSLLQTIFALCVVLGLLACLAWFMKRYGPKAAAGSAHVRLVGALNLGGRERIMVVEVGDQWIVVGASPGRVNALATMPRQPGLDAGAALHPHQPPASSFSEWLKQTIDNRNAK